MRTKEEILKVIAEKEMIFPVELSAKHYIQAMEQYKLEFAIAIMQNVIQDLQGEMVTTGQMSSFHEDLLKLQNQLNQIK